MFHLFDKVYLEQDNYYSGWSRSICLSASPKEHPVSSLTGRDFGTSLVWREYLEANFNGQIDLFFKSLINRSETDVYIIYCDPQIFHFIQFVYWRSIFAAPKLETIKELYSMCRADVQLRAYLVSDIRAKVIKDSSIFYPELSALEFKAAYDVAEPVSSLGGLDKSRVGFEYLLANYGFAPKSNYGRNFINKLRAVSWRHWFEDIESLKSELFNGILDLDKLYPDLESGANIITDLEDLFKNDSRLKWITDPDFRADNFRYVVDTYPREIFLELEHRGDNVAERIGFKDQAGKLVQSEFFKIDSAEFTNALYDDEIEKLLMLDIRRGFGCMFVAGNFQDRSNQVLTNAIYVALRQERFDLLAPFELK